VQLWSDTLCTFTNALSSCAAVGYSEKCIVQIHTSAHKKSRHHKLWSLCIVVHKVAKVQHCKSQQKTWWRHTWSAVPVYIQSSTPLKEYATCIFLQDHIIEVEPASSMYSVFLLNVCSQCVLEMKCCVINVREQLHNSIRKCEQSVVLYLHIFISNNACAVVSPSKFYDSCFVLCVKYALYTCFISPLQCLKFWSDNVQRAPGHLCL
jgi:hypothetical protein